MRRNLGWCAAVCLAMLAGRAHAQSRFARPIQLTEAEEIELALSAAPSNVAREAAVLVLRSTGYARVRDGSNGFTCVVEHEDPRAIEPVCYDAEGSATTLAVALFRAERRAAGEPDSVTLRAIDDGYRTGRFKAPGKPGIAYMLSPHASMPPHVMLYAPYKTMRELGLPGPGPSARGMPFLYNEGKPTAYVVVMVPKPSVTGKQTP